MKEMDPKNQKYSSEFSASQQLKKMIPQLLLSVSLFSFVFSYSSLYSSSPLSSLVYSPKFHYFFSGNYFQLLSNALNKNCLFLICNGLLVFLAKTSGFIRPPSGHDFNDVMQKGIGDTLQTTLEKYVVEEIAHEAKNDDYEEEEEGKGNNERPKEVSIFIAESEEEGGACDLEDEEKDENQPESRSCWLFDDDGDDEQQLYGEEVEEEREEEDEEEREDISTEELNQKFEDFIRRMKEEIIINEARQKVVMVK